MKELTREDFPTNVPDFINIAFVGFEELKDCQSYLPLGVFQLKDGFYYAKCYFGNRWGIFDKPFDNASECHAFWQAQYTSVLRQASQFYTATDIYDERMSKYLRLFIESIEADMKQGRETE